MKEGSRRKNNRGFTFVELLCTIAIFACISTAIGCVMVVTAKTYYSGTTESSLQQEAEQTANMIESLIVDATHSVTYYRYDVSASAYVQEESEAMAVVNGDLEDTDRKLEIVNNDPANPGTDLVYNILYDKDMKEIRYSEGTAPAAPTYILAENVIRFGVDVSNFASNHSVVIDIGMEKEDKQFDMTYNVTARNDNVASITYTPSEWLAYSSYDELVLEPGQTGFTITVTATGTAANKDFDVSLKGQGSSYTVVNKIGNDIKLTLGKDEKGYNGNKYFYLVIKSDQYAADGINPLALKVIPVYVRRADTINASITQDNPAQGPHDANTTYTVSAAVSGSYFAQKAGVSYDDSTNYKNPYYVKWDYKLYDESGAELTVSNYFDFTDMGDTNDPKLGIKLKQDMPVESQLKITAYSKHALGTVNGTLYNKSGVEYDNNVKATVVLDGPARPTVSISLASNEIILESGQTDFILPVTVTGTPGYTDSIDAVMTGHNSSSSSCTPVAGGVKISLGADETGSGTYSINLNIASSYTDDAGLPLDTENVTVRVRRVEDIMLALAQQDVSQAPYAAGTDYLVAATVTGQNLAQGDSLYDSDYKNPYFVQWDYVFTDKNGVVLNATDYFNFVNGGDSSSPYLLFELRQTMPEESTLTITGTSKHAAIGGAYNKSGVAYDTTVVATTTLNGPTASEPPIPTYDVDGSLFRRGQDYIFANEYLDSALRDATKKDDSDAQIRWFWRYREILGTNSYGDWSEYRMTGEQGSVKKINAAETYCLAPDKAYEVEYIYAVYSTSGDGSTGVIYWPYNTDLFAAGTGFEGYTAGWDAGETPTSAATYTTRYRIGKTAIRFYENTNFGVVAGATSIGTASSPLAFDKDTWFEVSMYTANMEFGHFQSAITWYMEKYNESTGVWESTTASGFDAELIGKALIKGIQSTTSGTYRLKCYMTSFNKVKMAGTVTAPTYVADTSTSYNLYDESTGEGMIYFKIN